MQFNLATTGKNNCRPSADVVDVDHNAATYTYDNDGNRTDLCATYDAQDRFGCGGATYTPDGRMTNDSLNTPFTYDALGNLTSAKVVSTGTTYAYTVDSQNRRIRKAHGATVDQQFLYGTGPYPIAELDSTGALKWTFYYATGRNVPDYAVYNGTTSGTKVNGHRYRLFTDHLGSVRVVYDTDASSVVQTMEYDAWGNVSSDTSPGYQPFGFAGGLYDKDTGLVRFGARDYNPRVARWMTKDASRFEGGLNLYRYAKNDPVDCIDPEGKNPVAIAIALGAAAGFALANWYFFDIETEDDAYDTGLKGAIDGPQDAYRHCLLACRLTNVYGPDVANYVCEQHEGDQHNPDNEMDRANNKVGIAYSQSSDTVSCEEQCMAGISEGTLTTLPESKWRD